MLRCMSKDAPSLYFTAIDRAWEEPRPIQMIANVAMENLKFSFPPENDNQLWQNNP